MFNTYNTWKCSTLAIFLKHSKPLEHLKYLEHLKHLNILKSSSVKHFQVLNRFKIKIIIFRSIIHEILAFRVVIGYWLKKRVKLIFSLTYNEILIYKFITSASCNFSFSSFFFILRLCSRMCIFSHNIWSLFLFMNDWESKLEIIIVAPENTKMQCLLTFADSSVYTYTP